MTEKRDTKIIYKYFSDSFGESVGFHSTGTMLIVMYSEIIYVIYYLFKK